MSKVQTTPAMYKLHLQCIQSTALSPSWSLTLFNVDLCRCYARAKLGVFLGNHWKGKMGLSSDPNVCGAAEQKGVVYLTLHSWINVSFTLLSGSFRILKGLASVLLQGQEGSAGAGL